MSSPTAFSIIVPVQGESWSELSRRLQATTGDVLVILSGSHMPSMDDEGGRSAWIDLCGSLSERVRVATKDAVLIAQLRAKGVQVLDSTRSLKALLADDERAAELLRMFTPALWTRQLTGRLRRMGVLSMPRVRIVILCCLSILLFSFVLFRLLPSAEIRITPRQETVSQTLNIYLAQSGANLPNLSDRARVMPLIPISVHLDQSLVLEHVSKEFIGTSATVMLTILNQSSEMYALRDGTRFTNQAGLVVRIQSHAIIEPGEEVTVRAVADDTDLYGEIIGDRGNVPEGVRWDIPGLAPEEREVVYAENRSPGAGGTTQYRSVLKQEDLDIARKRLEQELLSAAKEEVKQRLDVWNAREAGHTYDVINLSNPVLLHIAYGEFGIPEDLLGSEVDQVELSGSIDFVAFAYDRDAITDVLAEQLHTHVREGRQLIDERLSSDHLDVRIIEYDDDLQWMKVTTDLSAIEEYVLDPLTADGALFAKDVRELVAGRTSDDAARVVKNLTEVERVHISLWPPWNSRLPSIPSHIVITVEEE